MWLLLTRVGSRLVKVQLEGDDRYEKSWMNVDLGRAFMRQERRVRALKAGNTQMCPHLGDLNLLL